MSLLSSEEATAVKAHHSFLRGGPLRSYTPRLNAEVGGNVACHPISNQSQAPCISRSHMQPKPNRPTSLSYKTPRHIRNRSSHNVLPLSKHAWRVRVQVGFGLRSMRRGAYGTKTKQARCVCVLSYTSCGSPTRLVYSFPCSRDCSRFLCRFRVFLSSNSLVASCLERTVLD